MLPLVRAAYLWLSGSPVCPLQHTDAHLVASQHCHTTYASSKTGVRQGASQCNTNSHVLLLWQRLKVWCSMQTCLFVCIAVGALVLGW